jgi:hypothetical protein
MDKDFKSTSKHDQLLYVQVPSNSKIWKDKWKGFHLDYKIIVDYHNGTSHNISCWELVVDERDKLHLPRQFKHEFYEAIDTF